MGSNPTASANLHCKCLISLKLYLWRINCHIRAITFRTLGCGWVYRHVGSFNPVRTFEIRLLLMKGQAAMVDLRRVTLSMLPSFNDRRVRMHRRLRDEQA